MVELFQSSFRYEVILALSQPHITVTGLSRVFEGNSGSLLALSNVDLGVAWGEFVSIIGPSGCGKTTLLRTIGGLLQPTEGEVLIGGRSPEEAQRHKDIGFVFQDPALLPWRTVIANISLSLKVNRRTNGARDPMQLLDLVGLSEFRSYYPHQLSGGMKQRVALARALVFEPSVLLMDEPFGALDEITRSAMRYELLKIWERSKKTVVFVTHSITEAIVLSDRIVVMAGKPGRVKTILPVSMPRPREQSVERTSEFLSYAENLKNLLGQGDAVAAGG